MTFLPQDQNGAKNKILNLLFELDKYASVRSLSLENKVAMVTS